MRKPVPGYAMLGWVSGAILQPLQATAEFQSVEAAAALGPRCVEASVWFRNFNDFATVHKDDPVGGTFGETHLSALLDVCVVSVMMSAG